MDGNLSKKEEKRAAILKAASEVLREFGPKRARLDDIARQAGLAKTSLYYYFKDKKDLLQTIIRDELEYKLKLMAEAVDAHQSTEAKLCALMEVRYFFVIDHMQRTGRMPAGVFEPLSTEIIREKEPFLYAIKDLVEGILIDGVQSGELRSIDDLDSTALIIFASMVGCDHLFSIYGNHERIWKTIREITRIFFVGLRIDQ